MDARSIEILEQLKSEVWWPWDRRGDTDGGYNLRPQRPVRLGQTQEEHDAATEAYQRGVAEYDAAPTINLNRWGRLLGELKALNPTNPDVQKLRDMYQRIQTWHNTQNKSLWLEAMLR